MLTDAQKQTLQDHINASTDPAVVQALADGNNNALRDLYNLEASPAVEIWRHDITAEEIETTIDFTDLLDETEVTPGGTVADVVNALAVIAVKTTNDTKLDLLRQVVREGRTFDWRIDNLFGIFEEIFDNGTNSRPALAVMGKRNATLAESLFVDRTRAGAGVVSFIGDLTRDDIRDVINHGV